MKPANFLSFDLGAASGRAVLGQFDGSALTLDTIHQFPNNPLEISGHLYWNILEHFAQIQTGLSIFANQYGKNLLSLGIDTWGSDYAFLDADGQIMGIPYHYRDRRTDGMFDLAFKKISKEKIFEETGIAFLPFNTLYQLLADRTTRPFMLDHAATLLFVPDLLAYFLTGQKASEYTIATSGQIVGAFSRNWCFDLFKTFNIPERIFPSIQKPGTVRGELLKKIAENTNLDQVPVTAVASHDTASAVVAVPADDNDSFAYLSTGTWSLLGLEVKAPIINDKTLKWNLTNEGGFEDTYRVLKNVMGLWIVQECKKFWDSRGDACSYEDLVNLAQKNTEHFCYIDPDDDSFYSPGNMPQKICAFCEKTGQHIPQNKGQMLRCVLESLAFKYRWVIERLEEVQNKKIDLLYVVGGGVKNTLLNQLTADATGKTVICCSDQATSIGNIMVQVKAKGLVSNLREIRHVIRNSFPLQVYQPASHRERNNDAYSAFLKICTTTE